MEDLEKAQHLSRGGHFMAALSALDSLPLARRHRVDAEIARMELLERTGRYDLAANLAKKLGGTRELASGNRSSCEFVLGMIAWNDGRSVEAIEHLQRAIA